MLFTIGREKTYDEMLEKHTEKGVPAMMKSAGGYAYCILEEAIEEAEDVTVDIFDGQDEELDEFIDSEVKEHEQELQERTDSSESDFEKVSDAVDQIATDQTKDELERANTEIRDDIEFIDTEQQASQESREENETLQQQHRNRVHGGGR